jgi:hypothetical protein
MLPGSSASASQWLAAALSMHVLDALCPHNKNIVLFRLGMEKFLDGQAQSLSNPSKVKI